MDRHISGKMRMRLIAPIAMERIKQNQDMMILLQLTEPLFRSFVVECHNADGQGN